MQDMIRTFLDRNLARTVVQLKPEDLDDHMVKNAIEAEIHFGIPKQEWIEASIAYRSRYPQASPDAETQFMVGWAYGRVSRNRQDESLQATG